MALTDEERAKVEYMNKVQWVTTDKHVYGAIYREHAEKLSVFGSFSNPEPSRLSMTPMMVTEWGFAASRAPLIKHVVEWEHGKRKETEQHKYYLALVGRCEDCE